MKQGENSRPNIIYILADDLGYGDLGANNPQSKIPTPHLDRLAAQGMRFTDTHAASSVCTPSRYAILTGRYCWRSRLKAGIVWEWDGSLIEPDRLTVPGFLRQHGYHTACLGKWHLGWDWPTKDGRHPNETLPFGGWCGDQRAAFESQIDYTQPIRGGPVDRGFDTYFGVDVPNFAPYTWFENDRLTVVPTLPKPDHIYGQPGLMQPGWSHEAMLPEFTRRAVALIESRTSRAEPYFLYYALTAPHSPVVPNAPFRGRSGAGNYGDFVCEVDWVVGEIMTALDRTGTAGNTLLIFTSDNGPEDRTGDDLGVYERARRYRHYSMGDLRGMKRDAWEGGHRVPFIARWPGVIPAGQTCGQLTMLGDLLATVAEIVGRDSGRDGAPSCPPVSEDTLRQDGRLGQPALPPDGRLGQPGLPRGAGEDSVSILPLLRGAVDRPVRASLVQHSCAGRFVLRCGDWVFIDDPTGADNEEPAWFQQERGYRPHPYPGELYDLRADLSERVNRYGDHPARVRELTEMLARIKQGQPAASQAALAELSE